MYVVERACNVELSCRLLCEGFVPLFVPPLSNQPHGQSSESKISSFDEDVMRCETFWFLVDVRIRN